MSRAILPLVLLVPLVSACGEPKEKLVYPTDEKAMDAAIAEAKANQSVFWAKFDAASQPKDAEYQIKVRVPTPPHGDEFIWMDVVNRRGDEVTGILENEPVKFSGYRLGQTMTVKATEVSDWAYLKNGKYYGHFTTRLLMPQLPRDEQAQTKAMLWPTALEEPAK